jgi:hypothetical protein
MQPLSSSSSQRRSLISLSFQWSGLKLISLASSRYGHRSCCGQSARSPSRTISWSGSGEGMSAAGLAAARISTGRCNRLGSQTRMPRPLRTNSDGRARKKQAREARNTLNLRGAGAARLTGVGRGEGLRLRVGVSKRTEDGDSGAFWAGAFSAYIYKGEGSVQENQLVSSCKGLVLNGVDTIHL